MTNFVLLAQTKSLFIDVKDSWNQNIFFKNQLNYVVIFEILKIEFQLNEVSIN